MPDGAQEAAPQDNAAESGRNASAVGVQSLGAGRGKLFFLMTAKDHIEFMSIWVRFLRDGKRTKDYEAFVHCQNYTLCEENIWRTDIFTLIPTVPSRYCQNLVSPMVALLQAAVNNSVPGNPYDKFIFVSHNSLPVKPFWRAHQYFTEGQEGMATFDSAARAPCHIFKAAQWFILSYQHADMMLQAAAVTPVFNSTLRKIPTGCILCLDENWPIVTVFGAAELAKYPAQLPETLQIRRFMWVDWSNQAVRMDEQVEGGDIDFESEGPKGPRKLDYIPISLLKSLRASPGIMFMRKVTQETHLEDGLNLPAAWKSYVFKSLTGV